MKPWENVKRVRLRNRLITYGGVTVVITGALILLLSNPFRLNTDKPAANTPATRNTARKAALASLSSAIGAYRVTHSTLPVAIPKSPTQICTAVSADCRKAKTVDLNYLVNTDTGLQSIPVDPVGGSGITSSGYTIMQDSQGKLKFAAPRSENNAVIELQTK